MRILNIAGRAMCKRSRNGINWPFVAVFAVTALAWACALYVVLGGGS